MSDQTTILNVNVMHSGWEMDTKAWVTENSKGKRSLTTTSHGSPCVMSKKELLAKIQETDESLYDLRTAARLMGYDK
jgi:hypothetical protein